MHYLYGINLKEYYKIYAIIYTIWITCKKKMIFDHLASGSPASMGNW